MKSIFLTAEWRKLAMANYVIPAEVLSPYLPPHTELDFYQGNCYASLIGFMFLNTKLKGIQIPFHSSFEEVNLRFYVKYKEGNEWKRGAVFISEVVPKFMISLVANTLYKEHYSTLPMKHDWVEDDQNISVNYAWKKKEWYNFSVNATKPALPLTAGSEEEFITEHYWGYTKIGNQKTSEYGVEHPKWDVYKVNQYEVNLDFGAMYGQDFEFLNHQKPSSVFLVEGSDICVRDGRVIKK